MEKKPKTLDQSSTKRRHRAAIIAISFGLPIIILLSIYFFKFKEKTRYIPARNGPIVEAIYGLGKVKTHLKYEVKIGVASKIERAFVREGDRVEKGAPLLKFRDFATVKAPFAGTIVKFDFQEPEIVGPTDVIMTLENLDKRYIEVSLEQEGALRVRKGQSARVLFESLRGQVYRGKVNKVFPKDEEFLIHIEMPNLGEHILPGMTSDVAVEVANHQNATLIPLSSILNGKASIKRDGKKMKVPVRIGSVNSDWAQLVSGDIKPGDLFLQRKEN